MKDLEITDVVDALIETKTEIMNHSIRESKELIYEIVLITCVVLVFGGLILIFVGVGLHWSLWPMMSLVFCIAVGALTGAILTFDN